MKRILGMVAIPKRKANAQRIMDRFTLRVYSHRTGETEPRCFAHLRGSDVLIPGAYIPDARLPWPKPQRLREQVAPGWLHDYQIEALRALLSMDRGMLIAPAGCGKTEIGVAAIGCYGVRTVVVCPTVEIVDQWRRRIRERLDEAARRVSMAGDAQIVVDTYHTLRRAPRVLSRAGMVVVDEAHRTPCMSIERIMGACPARYRFGLTATPNRVDGLEAAMPWLFGPDRHAIRREHTRRTVMPVTVRVVRSGLPFPAGTTDQEQAILAGWSERNNFLSKIIISLVNAGRQTICLCRRLEQIENLKKLVDKSCSSAIVTGATGITERKRIIEGMQSGEIRCLMATFQLAAEGLDIPGLSALVMCAPTGNARLVEQACGRVARVAEGKRAPMVVDVVDNGRRAEYLFWKRCMVYRSLGYQVKGE